MAKGKLEGVGSLVTLIPISSTGQRCSAKYRYDKDWLNNGRMCGLSFVKENYSHLNAKKIVSTHHLLADVYGVTEVLHGLQLKIGILK